MKRFIIFCLVLCSVSVAGATTLSGNTNVSVTSDTAAVAKVRAMNQARRQILTSVLSAYANATAVSSAVANASSEELSNLISSSSIEGERTSDTTYTANITMVVDGGVAANWLNGQGIQNWLNTDSTTDNSVTVIVTLSDKLANWISLQEIARAYKIDMKTKYIVGDNAVVEIPLSARGTFMSAVAGGGWHQMNQDSTLRIWK